MATLVEAAVRLGPTTALVPIEGALADSMRVGGAEVHTSFHSEHLPSWRIRRIPGNFWGLFQAVRKFKPDLIHCHSALGNHYCKWIKRWTKLPLVTHQRDNYAADYFHSDLAAADGIIAISKWVASNLPEDLRRRTVTLLNPVALPTQIPTQRTSGALRIGMAGRCIPEKGFDLVVEAALPLFSAQDFELHFWGMQENDYGKALLEQLKPFQDRVQIESFRNDIDVFYSSMDIVIVPSRYPEPMGRMAIEAMAWGTPVIAAGHGGLVELIEDGQTGLLFEPGNVKDLSSKIQQLVSDSDLRKRLGENGREWVAEHLNPDRYASQVGEFYQQVLSRVENKNR